MDSRNFSKYEDSNDGAFRNKSTTNSLYPECRNFTKRSGVTKFVSVTFLSLVYAPASYSNFVPFVNFVNSAVLSWESGLKLHP